MQAEGAAIFDDLRFAKGKQATGILAVRAPQQGTLERPSAALTGSLVAEGDHGIDTHGATSRYVAGGEGDERECEGDEGIG